jgi:hypothetical protein
MLYAILCYNSEAALGALSKAEEATPWQAAAVNTELTAERKLTMTTPDADDDGSDGAGRP